MASSRDTAAELVMDNPDKTEAWLCVFSAKCRHKKLRDTDDSKEIMAFFISTAGLNAIQQVTTMVKPYNLEDMNFADIEKIIMEKIRPKKKLIIAERAHFMQSTNCQASLSATMHNISGGLHSSANLTIWARRKQNKHQKTNFYKCSWWMAFTINNIRSSCWNSFKHQPRMT